MAARLPPRLAARDLVAGLVVWSVVGAAGGRLRADRGLPPAGRAWSPRRARCSATRCWAPRARCRERDDGHVRALRRRRRPARRRRRRALRGAVGAARRWSPRPSSSAAGRAARWRRHRLRLQAGDDRLPVRPRAHDRRGPAAEISASMPAAATSSSGSPTCSGSSATSTRRPRRSARPASRPAGAAPARARLPGTLIVLAAAIALSELLDLRAHGVDVVGELPDALPDPALPDVALARCSATCCRRPRRDGAHAEAAGVARALAPQEGYEVDVNRELVAIGGANLLAGLLVGLRPVRRREPDRRGRARGRQDAARLDRRRRARPAHGRVARAPVRPLPDATLAAIVSWPSAASSGSTSCALRPHPAQRPGARLVALGGVLLLGVLPGLLVAAVLSLARRSSAQPALGRAARARPRRADVGRVPTCTTPGRSRPRSSSRASTARCSTRTPARSRTISSPSPAGSSRGRRSPCSSSTSRTSTSRRSTCWTSSRTRSPASASSCAWPASARARRELLRRTGLADRVRLEPTLDAATRDGGPPPAAPRPSA